MTIDGMVPGYPPAHHVLRDLAIEVQHARTGSRAWLPCPEPVRNERGRVRLGALATAVDAVCGGLAAVTAAPGWIATADLTLHVIAPLEADELVATATVRRAGRTTIVVGAEVASTSRPETTLAVASLTFSVLHRRESNPVIAIPDDESVAPRRSFMGETSQFDLPVYDACGFRTVGAGVVEVDPQEYIVNSLGAVQGGVLASLVDAATVSALGPDTETADLQLVYLALAKQGPIRASATVERADDDAAVTSVVVDDLAAERRTSVARCTGVRW